MKILVWDQAKCPYVRNSERPLLRDLFSYISMVSAGDFSFVCSKEVSVIAGCPQGGS